MFNYLNYSFTSPLTICSLHLLRDTLGHVNINMDLVAKLEDLHKKLHPTAQYKSEQYHHFSPQGKVMYHHKALGP